MTIDVFPHEAVVGVTMVQAKGVALLRLTAYATLACFLRLQVACCCAAHGASSAEIEFDRVGCCSVASSGHLATEKASTCCDQHGSHNHGANAGKSEQRHGDCHICVISHLRFVPAKYPPQPIAMHVASTDSSIPSVATLQFDAEGMPRLHALTDGNLLACGTLLRI